MVANILVLYSRTFTNLSVPSVIFAEDEGGASWYGSLRGGVEFGGGADGQFGSYGSRWGIKGTSEVSEGLTALYQLETRINGGVTRKNPTPTNTENISDSQGTNQLFVGLSGGFGNLTMGKFHNAAYLAGGIRDIGNWYSSGDVATKVGNTVSYGFASETFKLQIDAIMDGRDTGRAVDETQFGLAVNIGDIGKVAIGYEKAEDATTDKTATGGMLGMADGHAKAGAVTYDNGTLKGMETAVWRKISATDNSVVMQVGDFKLKSGYMEVSVIQMATNDTFATITHDEKTGKYYSDNCTIPTGGSLPSGCTTTKKHIVKVTTTAATENLESTTVKPTKAYAKVEDNDLANAHTAQILRTAYGYKAGHVSASFGLGAVTARLGYSSKDSNDPMKTKDMKTTYFGMDGSIGDSGMDWRAWGRNVEAHDGKETSPWGAGVGKALGGGAYAWIEHANADAGASGTTSIALNVNF